MIRLIVKWTALPVLMLIYLVLLAASDVYLLDQPLAFALKIAAFVPAACFGWVAIQRG